MRGPPAVRMAMEATVITSFGSDATAALYHARQSSLGRRMPPAAQARLLRRLDMLNAAHDLGDLRSLRDAPVQPVAEERRGRLGIRVEGGPRISFRWEDGEASDVATDREIAGEAA
ncbi:MAG: hypothetical protein V3R95_01805 [Dehalococcoidia bacterium]